jgi:hypothetical protein
MRTKFRVGNRVSIAGYRGTIIKIEETHITTRWDNHGKKIARDRRDFVERSFKLIGDTNPNSKIILNAD